MAQGFWFNNDGLPIQYGTQKAIPELGGEFKSYGEWREIETYICLAQTTWGALGSMPSVPALPSSFTGTSTPIAAGIQSLTSLVPLQTVAIPAAAASGNGLLLVNPYLWLSQVDIEVLVTANAGTGAATGLSGIGLAFAQPGASGGTFVQCTPNAGTQILGAISNAQMTAGKHYTFYASGTLVGDTGPTAGSWLGQVPLLTNTPPAGSFNNAQNLPQEAYISALATGGTYSGTTASGLLKLRLKYFQFGNINQ